MFDSWCIACPLIPWGFVASGVVVLLGLYFFVKVNATEWKQVAGVKQILNHVQNLNIANQILVVWPAFYADVMKFFKVFTIQ